MKYQVVYSTQFGGTFAEGFYDSIEEAVTDAKKKIQGFHQDVFSEVGVSNEDGTEYFETDLLQFLEDYNENGTRVDDPTSRVTVGDTTGNLYEITIDGVTETVDLNGYNILCDEDFETLEKLNLTTDDMISPNQWDIVSDNIFLREALKYHANYHCLEGREAKVVIESRLEYLRGEIQKEQISYSEIFDLQSLLEYIEDGDVELLEWVKNEFEEEEIEEK